MRLFLCLVIEGLGGEVRLFTDYDSLKYVLEIRNSDTKTIEHQIE